MYKIHLLPASFGDSILIEYGDAQVNYILIDGGPYFAFEEMFEGLKRVAPKLTELELLVITHIDIDHIDGIIMLLNQDHLPFKIREVWFNGFKQIKEADDLLGPLQGEYMTLRITENDLPHNTSFNSGPVVIQDYNALPRIVLPGGMELILVNPGLKSLAGLLDKWQDLINDIGNEAAFKNRLEEDDRYESDLLGEESTIEELQVATIPGDKSKANLSSIAFIGKYDEKYCLFAADASSDALLPAIQFLIDEAGGDRLHLNAWKLAHHGSKGSTLTKLMEKIDCKQMLISSDGKRYKHPNEETIARLIANNGPDLTFYFNYRTSFNERWDGTKVKEDYKFSSFYPDQASNGITITL
jgi:beta-lactamase superfamily II metal-dependent hydrolase